MTDAGNRGLRAGALVFPALLLVAVFLLAPLGLILRFSLDVYDPSTLMKGVFALDNYVKLLKDDFYTGVLVFTAQIAALSTVICLALGYPVAYFISRSRSEKMRSILIILTVLPLLMGNAVRSAAWMVVMGSNGMINGLLLALGVINEPIKILYTPTAVVVGLVSVLMPFAIITLQSVLDSIPVSLEEAGRSLGYSPLRTMVAVVMPLSIPGIVAAGAICFCLAMNAYATPVLIGGPSVHMMGPLVFQQISKVGNWPFGSALAWVLMTVTLVMTIVSATYLNRKYF
ncbi:MAG: ABC transporter permease [Usitatibacter sp.]